MKATPLFLGACAVASIAGAVGGATTNTTPIREGGIGSELLPESYLAFDPADDGLPEAAPPDHYAMMTPEGRVDVAELSTRGLYAQQRFGWGKEFYEPPVETFDAEEFVVDPWERSEAAEPELPEPAEPEAPSATSPAVHAASARVIDVAAALAAREPTPAQPSINTISQR